MKNWFFKYLQYIGWAIGMIYGQILARLPLIHYTYHWYLIPIYPAIGYFSCDFAVKVAKRFQEEHDKQTTDN